MNILRRLPLSRLLLLCGARRRDRHLRHGARISRSAPGPRRPPSRWPRPSTTRSAGRPPVQGFSAEHRAHQPPARRRQPRERRPAARQRGGLASSPLLNGGSGRLWVAKDGRVRLELQAEKGDTQIVYDGHTAEMYDAADEHALPLHAARAAPTSRRRPRPATPPTTAHEAPSVAKIEEAIAHVRKHANVSGATPTDVAGQPAYTVRVSPKEGGSLIGGAELSFDADNGAAAAGRHLLLHQLRAGDRTGRHRSVLRAVSRLGLRVHAARGRQDRRDQARPSTPASTGHAEPRRAPRSRP